MRIAMIERESYQMTESGRTKEYQMIQFQTYSSAVAVVVAAIAAVVAVRSVDVALKIPTASPVPQRAQASMKCRTSTPVAVAAFVEFVSSFVVFVNY